MVNNILYQVRVDVDEGLATEIRRGNYSEEAGAIKDKLKEFGAELICQFDAFSNYIIESEKTGDIDNPLYKWTKDTIANTEKKKKYLKSFTIYVEDNQLYEKDIAAKIEKSLQSLKNKKILEIRTFNSDPKNNPQPPKKYF